MADRPKGSTTDTPRRLLIATLAGDAFWVAAYAALALAGMQGSKLFSAFDLNAEANPPTWWSSAKLLLIGVILLVLAVRPFVESERLSRMRPALWLLGGAFVFLSADESGVIHERMTGVLSRTSLVPTFLRTGWESSSVTVAAVYGIVALALLWFLRGSIAAAWRDWRRELLLVAAGVAMFVLGAVVVELVGFVLPVPEHLEIAIEEGFELVGSSVILFAAASMLASEFAALLASRAGCDAEAADDAELAERA